MRASPSGERASAAEAPVAEGASAAASTFVAPRDPDRFELKYWVPEEQTAKVLAYARPHLILDPESARRGLLHQCCTTLYLETQDLDFFEAHVEGVPDRFKLRVRAYGDPPAGTAFFEIKRKIDSRGVKTRAAVPLDQVRPILEGAFDRLPEWMKASARLNLQSFLHAQLAYQARPFLLVRAFRESYCSADPREEVRMTFDRRICYQPARGATFDHDPEAWIPIDGEDQHGERGPHALIEMKFPRLSPFWVSRVASQLELRRVSFSKYCSAVRAHLGSSAEDDATLDLIPTRG